MALIRCVNTNFGFMLNTSYCKCIKNMKRLIMNNSSETEIIERSIPSITFNDMISFREQQAKRSILVKIGDERDFNEVVNICASRVKILNVFHYFTKYNTRYALVELSESSEAQLIKSKTIRSINNRNIYVKSNILLYNNANMSSIMKQNQTATKKIWETEKFIKTLRKHTSVSVQMAILYNSLKITDLDIRLRFFTAQQISMYLNQLFYNINISPFGSSISGFGQIGCDLDLSCVAPYSSNISFDNMKLQFLSVPIDTNNGLKQKEFLEAIGTIMNNCIPEIGNVKKILRARVPIIKFSYLATNIECDLSNSNNVTAIKMTKALYTYGLIDWRIKPLVCTIRTWAKNMCITRENPGSWITNYSLTMLVLFYLQVANILPSLNIVECNEDQMLRKYKTNHMHTQVVQNEKIHDKKNGSLCKLLYGFFEYYNSFNFEKYGICIREATIKENLKRSPMYIYNPYNNKLNVSQNINQKELIYMKNHIRNALKLLNTDNCTITNLLGLPETNKCTHTLVSMENNRNNKKQTNNTFVDKKLVANKIDGVTLEAKKNM